MSDDESERSGAGPSGIPVLRLYIKLDYIQTNIQSMTQLAIWIVILMFCMATHCSFKTDSYSPIFTSLLLCNKWIPLSVNAASFEVFHLRVLRAKL